MTEVIVIPAQAGIHNTGNPWIPAEKGGAPFPHLGGNDGDFFGAGVRRP